MNIMTIDGGYMREAVPIHEAKKELSHFIRQAEHGEPVVISRRGQPVVALVSTELLAQLERLRAASPEDGLAGLRPWDDSEELVGLLEKNLRQSREHHDLE